MKSKPQPRDSFDLFQAHFRPDSQPWPRVDPIGPEDRLPRADRMRCRQPKDKNKLFDLHEPEVQCIRKSKAHKRYEFGQKIVPAKAWPTLATVEHVTGAAGGHPFYWLNYLTAA